MNVLVLGIMFSRYALALLCSHQEKRKKFTGQYMVLVNSTIVEIPAIIASQFIGKYMAI